MANKIKYITTSQHSMVGDSAPLAPGDRVLVDDENNTHKHLVKLIEAEDPSVEHLSLVEVSPGDEKKSQEEAKEMQVKAEKLAAEAREEEARAAQEELEKQLNVAEQQSPHSDPTDFPPQDVEAQKLAEQSGAGQRASTQEDVADEDKESKSSGRRSRKG